MMKTIREGSKPFVAIFVGILFAYMWYLYDPRSNLLLFLAVFLIPALLAYAILSGFKLSQGIINVVRYILGTIFGLFIGYSWWLQSRDLGASIAVALISIAVSVYLLLNLDKKAE
jgi:drug/metabolite transporter (DMT)-like permease